MANVCVVTGKTKLKGHRVSHANNKSIHFQQPATQKRRVFIPELGLRIQVNISNAGLRILNRVGGFSRFLVSADTSALPPKLRRLRKVLLAKGVH